MSDTGTAFQALIALLFVLCLIGLCAAGARRFAPGIAKRMPGRNRRLQVLEILPLDTRHRAVLLRCDERDHLLVMGEGGVTVIDHPATPATNPGAVTGATTP